MPKLIVIWDDDSESEGNVQHIAEHGLTTEDVEFVLLHSRKTLKCASTSRPLVFGYTPGGEYIAVVFEWIDKESVYPITAYEVPEPK